ncbi:MAG: YciI family protein [Thermoleophilia bacterium]|nr:YciI family protein [Thermoleophilia bacterium]
MPKYMLIYRDSTEPRTPPSPEEMQGFLAMWGDWFAKSGAAIVDGGDGLKHDGRVLKPGGIVSDGPYAEAKEIIGGYTLIQAENYDEAVKLAAGCPIFITGGAVEIRQLAGYTG